MENGQSHHAILFGSGLCTGWVIQPRVRNTHTIYSFHRNPFRRFTATGQARSTSHVWQSIRYHPSIHLASTHSKESLRFQSRSRHMRRTNIFSLFPKMKFVFFFFLLFSSSICMSKCKLISWEERKKPKLCSFECQMSFHRERIKINIVMRNSSVCSNLLLRSSKAASIQLAPGRIACSQFYSCTAADSADSNLWCLLVCWIVSRLVSLGRSHTVHSICVWTDGRNSLVHKCSQWISLYHPV